MGKTVLVSGGTRGIGRACVEHFYALGYNVAFCYKNSEALANEICEKFTGVLSFCADVAVSGEVNAMVTDVINKFGRIDALVCNAGIAQQSVFCDITDEQWNEMISTNLGGTFNCCRAVLPHMIGAKRGKIVTLSSIWGVTGGSCEVHYSASKAGIIGLTKALAKEVGPSGVNVNCVAPGVVDTDMNADFDEETTEQLKEETPLCRLGTPNEIARVISFLCSEDSDFITGQVISPNGGILI